MSDGAPRSDERPPASDDGVSGRKPDAAAGGGHPSQVSLDERDSAATRLSAFPQLTPAVHGGVDVTELVALGIDPATVVDFSSNQSPLGASPRARAALEQAVIDAYPDRDASRLAAAFADRHGLSPEQVVVGNGSTELIRLVAQLALRPGDTALSLAPSFGEYEVATDLAGARFVERPLAFAGADRGFVYDAGDFASALERERPRLCWLCSPNNPTGAAIPAGEIAGLVAAHPATLFVLDEAYCDLLPDPQWTAALLSAGNLVVLRSMTKAWGLAGLRLGYALAAPPLAAPLRSAKPPWNVNACAQLAGLAALADEQWHQRSLAALRDGRDRLVSGLRELGFAVMPTAAGFFLVYVADAAAAREHLLAQSCLVRDCTSFGLPAYVRVSPRLPDDNARLLAAFAALGDSTRDAGTGTGPTVTGPEGITGGPPTTTRGERRG